ncbi:MAG: hypothetical protein NC311_06740 [Muribaculaceae bacterium]|nr:hypothetical protein [Muribaculaceae bacterium]
MSMQTPDGKKTNKFDAVVPCVYLDRVDGLQDTLTELEKGIRSDITTLSEAVEENNKKHNEAEAILNNRQNELIFRISDDERLILAFLCSPLMRFLNFFGCWYIYANGYPLLNLPKNERYGKAPLLTRISRWFRKRFLKQPVQSGTYYKSEETKESNMEVCTNEKRNVSERVEASESEGSAGAVLERDPDGDP